MVPAGRDGVKHGRFVHLSGLVMMELKWSYFARTVLEKCTGMVGGERCSDAMLLPPHRFTVPEYGQQVLHHQLSGTKIRIFSFFCFT